MKQEELQQVWQERSQEAFVQVAQWQQEHPSATLAEIEEMMDRHLLRLRAQLLQEVAQHREVTPLSASSPPVPSVQQRCKHGGRTNVLCSRREIST